MYNQNEYINEYLIKSFEDLGKTQAEVIEFKQVSAICFCSNEWQKKSR